MEPHWVHTGSFSGWWYVIVPVWYDVIVYSGHAYMASIFSRLLCLVQSVFKKLKLPDKRYISLPEGQAGPGLPLDMFLKNVPH